MLQPVLVLMAVLTFIPQTAVMGIFFLVTLNALLRCVAKLDLGLMTGEAGHLGMVGL